MQPLDDNLDSVGRIKRLLGFHHFKPALDRFLDINQGFIPSFPLRQASGQGRHFSYIVSRLILLNDYVQFHGSLRDLWGNSLYGQT